MRARLSAPAEGDLAKIWTYVVKESDSLEIADRLIDSIAQTIGLIGRNPHVGRSRPELRPNLRSFPVGSYVIFYRTSEGEVLILRVLHGRQDIEPLLG